MAKKQKITRGISSQFFIAGELCRHSLSAVVTLGNTPNTDILCSNIEGTKFVHIQVKTFVPGNRTCSVGAKAERFYGNNFFWILGGIPRPEDKTEFVYYIIPSKVMAKQIADAHQYWLNQLGKRGQKHNETTVRTVHIPPGKSIIGWDISKYKNRWDLILRKLRA
jgi:hypothetical protein